MLHKCLAIILLCTAGTLAGPAAAIDLLDGRLQVNTYGTVGIARSGIEHPGYRSNYSYQFDVDKDWTGRLDNRLGVQISAHLDPTVSVITQALVRRNGGDEVDTDVTWGYLRWKPDTRWEVRLGRVRQPLFMTSEEFDVGYSQPWVRPPAELYTLVGEITTIDGIDIRHRLPLGNYTLNLEGFAGVNSIDRPLYSVKTHLLSGLAAVLTDGALTLRGAIVQSSIDYKSPRAQPLYNLIAAQSAAVASDYATGDISGIYYGNLGVRYESRGWLTMAEYGQVRSPKLTIGEYQAGYVTIGRSFDEWMPYVTLSRIRRLSQSHEDRLTGAAASAANAYLAGTNKDQSALSLGVRWDAAPGVAFKAQVDRVRPDAGAYGLQARPLPAGQSAFNVVSFVMDWAF